MGARQLTKNCHFISRFLTKSWEGKNRQLLVFDFGKFQFAWRSSKSLFSGRETNSEAVENWLRDTLETPLAQIHGRLLAADPTALDNYRFFRAALLMLWLQGARTKSVVDADARGELEWLSSRSDQELDHFVNSLRQEFALRLVFTIKVSDRYAPVFVPSSGIFRFVYRDAGCVSGWASGIALPLHPFCALVATGAETHGKVDLSHLSASLSNVSVGTSDAQRVVVPPDTPEDQLESLKAVLVELRALNDELVTDVGRVHQLVKTMFATAGIRPASDAAGRFLPANRRRRDR